MDYLVNKTIDWNIRDSTIPKITGGPDNHIHVVWQDEGSYSGFQEIFNRKGIQYASQ